MLLLFTFGLSKCVTFITPILFSNVVEVSSYGEIEYILSVGFLLAAPLSLGLHGSYPYFNLKLNRTGYRSLFEAHSLILVGVAMLALVGYLFMDNVLWLALALGGLVAIQLIKSSIQKSHEQIQVASVLDSGVYYFLCIYLAIKSLLGMPFQVFDLVLPFGSYLFVMFIWSLKDYLTSKGDYNKKRYKESIAFGITVVISGFLMNGLVMGGRVAVEYFLGFEQVAYYGFYFRLAAVIVIFHQIINIAFFKKIYQSLPKTLDFYFSLLLLILIIGSVSLWWLVPMLFSSFFEVLRNTYTEFKWLYFIFAFYAVLWISMALGENIVYREKLAGLLNRALVVLIFVVLCSLFLLNSLYGLDLHMLAMVFMIGIYLACEIQHYLLRTKRSINLLRMRMVNRFIIVMFFIVYLVK